MVPSGALTLCPKGEMMREFETIYLLKPDLPAEQLATIKEKISNTIKKGEGHVLSHADWGKRKLAYYVKKFRHAQYFYLQFLDSGAHVGELERILKFDDNVLKFLTVKLKDEVKVEERLAEAGKEPLPPEEPFSYQRPAESTPYRGRPREEYPSREGKPKGPPAEVNKQDEAEKSES